MPLAGVMATKTALDVYIRAPYRTTERRSSRCRSFTFSDGNDATFAYTVNGVSQAKAITREVFTNPGTVCQGTN